ncbi:PINIT domain-containing protein [Fennellomyces sp. T-0311]|nr:PINIT domain-containing protein [Fennellomyces sp. T-0311]
MQVTAMYKYGPFFEVTSELSPPSLCQSALHARSIKSFTFTLNPAQQQQINDQTHEVRFFCAKYRSDGGPALMEFPDVCEVRVNAKTVVSAQQLRGIKNNPGTINPPDLTKFIQKTSQNTVDLVYAHSVHEYVACVRLVRRHTVESLVKNLVDSKFVSKDVVLEKFVKEQQEADVMIEFQTVSMKCPLAFTRIQIPCRASACTHAQCFDAYTFLKMNEQTPTWSCPACSRSIGSYNDLLVDGYFQNILDTVGQNVESVRIGADGQIQYIKEDPDEVESRESTPESQIKRESSTSAAATITILDEDDEIEQVTRGVKRTADEQITSGTSSRPRTNHAVIDLTLSDDEDEETSQPHNGAEHGPVLTPNAQTRLVLLPPVPVPSTPTNPPPSQA